MNHKDTKATKREFFLNLLVLFVPWRLIFPSAAYLIFSGRTLRIL